MTKDYKKVFAKFWGYGGQYLPDTCWGCYKEPPVDINHLLGRGMGGDPKGKKNNIRINFATNHQNIKKASKRIENKKKKEKVKWLNIKVDQLD